jgi:ribosomal-protein-alanine N-acetyltransferase
MRSADVPAIMDIESVSFGRHHWSEESFYNEMDNQVGRYYVLLHHPESGPEKSRAAEASRIIGYCGFWLIVDEAHVTTVAVHPDYRGQSLGELVLLQILERCLGNSIRWVTLEVRATNYNAQNLYYKHGFVSMGIRPRYYQDNQEDALIMTTPDIASEEQRRLHKSLKHALRDRLGGFPKGFGL